MGTSGSAQLQAFVDGVIWLSLEELGPAGFAAPLSSRPTGWN